MLDLLARHGKLDLDVTVTGDLQTGAHHTAEDTAIVLGQALTKALGEKRGVRRFANSLVPLDEALVQVALDLSGRPFLVYAVEPVALDTITPSPGLWMIVPWLGALRTSVKSSGPSTMVSSIVATEMVWLAGWPPVKVRTVLIAV